MWNVGINPLSATELATSNLSSFHYSVTAMAVVGILLAIFNEDASHGSERLSWISHELLPMPETKLRSKEIENTWNGALNGVPFYNSLLLLWSQIVVAVFQGQFLNLLLKWYESLRGYVLLRWEIFSLNRMAESKLHLMYLVEKKALDIPISKGESMRQSYIDAKRYMRSHNKWPFLLPVRNVRKKKVLCVGKEAIPFSSYSYLDMLRDTRVQEAAILAAQEYSTGNHGPRMLGGGAEILRELEKTVGQFFGREDSLVLSAGYLACLSAICAVAGKGDLILYDSRAHASLQAGVKLSGAVYKSFHHDDFHDCRKLLEKYRKSYKACWVIIESVYSMDGDIANLPAAHEVCKQYNCQLLLDEAHGLGVLGKSGRGLEEHFNLPNVCDVIVGTFSKSAGGIGGYITGTNEIVEYLDFHSPGNLFSAPLTAYSAGGIIKAFEIMHEEPEIINRLQKNILYLRKALLNSSLWPKDYPDSQKYVVGGCEFASVIPVIYPGDMDRVFRIGWCMLELGYMVSSVGYPACPFAAPRLRITATSSLTTQDMDDFAKTLVKASVDVAPTSSPFM